MVNDEQIAKAFDGTNFGVEDADRRAFLARTIFKKLAGYATGHTITCILTELGMTKSNYAKPIKEARRWAYHQYHPHA